jgi:hypothetical protein
MRRRVDLHSTVFITVVSLSWQGNRRTGEHWPVVLGCHDIGRVAESLVSYSVMLAWLVAERVHAVPWLVLS